MPKISEYTSVSGLDGTEQIVLNQSGVTRKGTINDIVPMGITAAETASSITPTNYEYEPGDIARYGAVDDDSTDCLAAINAAILQYRNGGDPVKIVRRTTGIFRHSDSIEWGYDTMRAYGIGKVWLKHTGTGVANFINEADAAFVYDVRILNIESIGNANTTYCWDIFMLSDAELDIKARDCTTAGFRLDLFVVSRGTFVCSANQGAFSTQPTNGLVCQNQVTDSELRVVLEGVSGDGLVLTSCDYCVFTGTSEGNGGWSINESSSCTYNTFLGFFSELNTSGGYQTAATGSHCIGCNFSELAASPPYENIKGAAILAAAERITFTNTRFAYVANVASGAEATAFYNCELVYQVEDSGTNTVTVNTKQLNLSSAVFPSKARSALDWANVTYNTADSWTNTSGTYVQLQYTQDYSENVVKLRGEAGGGTSTTTITTLPTLFRPQKVVIVNCPEVDGTGQVIVSINTDGTVVHVAGDTTSFYFDVEFSLA